MSDAKHTPGPWESTMACEEPDGSFLAYVHAGAATIASVRTRGQENAEADARCCAAAPELLAACENLLATIRGECLHSNPCPIFRDQAHQRAWVEEQARAAIAKAKGGAK